MALLNNIAQPDLNLGPYFSFLPREVISLILSYLSFKDLYIAQRINKYFLELIAEMKPLEERIGLDLDKSHYPTDLQEIEKLSQLKKKMRVAGVFSSCQGKMLKEINIEQIFKDFQITIPKSVSNKKAIGEVSSLTLCYLTLFMIHSAKYNADNKYRKQLFKGALNILIIIIKQRQLSNKTSSLPFYLLVINILEKGAGIFNWSKINKFVNTQLGKNFVKDTIGEFCLKNFNFVHDNLQDLSRAIAVFDYSYQLRFFNFKTIINLNKEYLIDKIDATHSSSWNQLLKLPNLDLSIIPSTEINSISVIRLWDAFQSLRRVKIKQQLPAVQTFKELDQFSEIKWLMLLLSNNSSISTREWLINAPQQLSAIKLGETGNKLIGKSPFGFHLIMKISDKIEQIEKFLNNKNLMEILLQLPLDYLKEFIKDSDKSGSLIVTEITTFHKIYIEGNQVANELGRYFSLADLKEIEDRFNKIDESEHYNAINTEVLPLKLRRVKRSFDILIRSFCYYSGALPPDKRGQLKNIVTNPVERLKFIEFYSFLLTIIINPKLSTNKFPFIELYNIYLNKNKFVEPKIFYKMAFLLSFFLGNKKFSCDEFFKLSEKEGNLIAMDILYDHGYAIRNFDFLEHLDLEGILKKQTDGKLKVWLEMLTNNIDFFLKSKEYLSQFPDASQAFIEIVSFQVNVKNSEGKNQSVNLVEILKAWSQVYIKRQPNNVLLVKEVFNKLHNPLNETQLTSYIKALWIIKRSLLREKIFDWYGFDILMQMNEHNYALQDSIFKPSLLDLFCNQATKTNNLLSTNFKYYMIQNISDRTKIENVYHKIYQTSMYGVVTSWRDKTSSGPTSATDHLLKRTAKSQLTPEDSKKQKLDSEISSAEMDDEQDKAEKIQPGLN